MAEVRSPTVRRRELGALLRAFRLHQGLTVEQVAELLMCSPSKVSRMETGHRGVTARDIRDLCDIYGITDQSEQDRLATLAREGRQQAWWQSYELANFATYVGLEADAIRISDYQCTVIPGLLQTAGYARAANDVVIPAPTAEQVAEQTEVRLKRQDRLIQEPLLSLGVVLDEAAIHREVGGPAVMGAQLERLVEVSSLPNVTLQVLPYNAGAYPAMDSPFNILEFAGDVPSVVYVEGLAGWLYVDRQQDIDRYQQVFHQLCNIALSPQESIKLVARISLEHKRA